MTITKTWFIETTDYDDVLVSINIDTPFEKGDNHKQLELFTTEDHLLEDISY
jgi:hypothetical protein